MATECALRSVQACTRLLYVGTLPPLLADRCDSKSQIPTAIRSGECAAYSFTRAWSPGSHTSLLDNLLEDGWERHVLDALQPDLQEARIREHAVSHSHQFLYIPIGPHKSSM